MEDLLVRLVEAPTLLGQEAAGQAVMRDAFAELGLEPLDLPLDPEVLRGHPGASPFSWDVAGKANVVAAWPRGRAGGWALARPQRAHRRGEPGAGGDVGLAAVQRPARRRLALRARGGRHEGRPRGDRRRRARPHAARPCAAGTRGPAVGGGGGMQWQWGPGLRAGRAHRRCRDRDRAHQRRHPELTGGRALVRGPAGRAPGPRRRRARGAERDRGRLSDHRRATCAGGGAERRPAGPLRRLSPPDQPQRGRDPRR